MNLIQFIFCLDNILLQIGNSKQSEVSPEDSIDSFTQIGGATEEVKIE